MIEILDIANSCSSAGLWTILTVFKRILQFIHLIGPLVFLVIIVVHLIKLISSPEDKKLFKKLINSSIALIVLFFVPVFVDAVMGILDDTFTLSACWNSIPDSSNLFSSNYIDPNSRSNDNASSIYNNPDNYEQGEEKTQSTEKTDVQNTSSGLYELKFNGWDYYLYVPKNVNSNKPLIVYMHGNYNQGHNLSKLLEDGGFAAHIKNGAEYNSYILMPQLPSGTWLDNESTLMALIEQVITEHGIDRNRICISGFSMGANSVPYIVNNHPNYFASAVIMSIQYYSPAHVNTLKNIPTRIYYGESDQYASSCQPLYNALNAAGGKVEIFAYQNQGHAYLPKRILEDTDSNVMAWILSQKRS